MFWPIFLIVSANILYHIVSKLTPQQISPFFALSVTYLVAAVISVSFYFLMPRSRTISEEMGLLNWTSLALGFAIVFLEAGYIYLYRVGWKISIGSLAANSLLALALIVIGAIFFGESLGPRQIGGILFCLLGLTLINL